MTLRMQGLLLRFLETGDLQKVGAHRAEGRVDVRVIAATNKNLRDLIAQGQFREDLFYRLNVVPVDVPPLADRRDDIPALADHFFTRHAREQGLPVPEISPEAQAALQAYDWPGNVRQLRNVVERTVILAPRERMERIEPDMLPAEITGGSADNGAGISTLMGVPLREARESFEREYLRIQIRRFSGNISKTAGFIGMERSALHRKLKLLGMSERTDAFERE
jgi:two-component system nitrogen regulation response regulator NtrX